MRRAAKVDSNQSEIVVALRKIGARVTSTAAIGMSERKRVTAIENLKKAIAANQERVTGIWKCEQCGTERRATVHQMRKKYCYNACVSAAYKIRMSGAENPNYKGEQKICLHCGSVYQNYSKRSKYCGLSCRDKELMQLRTNAKKDANHNEIVDLLVAGGAEVKDMSRAMFGVPDLLVWYREQWTFVEIKNPQTGYGKKGLNAAQEKWAKDWRGGAVVILRTSEEVRRFLDWDMEALEKVGGYMEVHDPNKGD